MEAVFVAGLTRFDRSVDKIRYPRLPKNPGRVHAYWQIGMNSRINMESSDPLFMDMPGLYEKALCGVTLKVLLPIKFSSADPDACQTCSKALEEKQDETRRLNNSTLVARNYKSVKL